MNHYSRFTICSFVALWLLLYSATGQLLPSINAIQFQTTELRLVSATKYTQPVKDVIITCECTHENGQRLIVQGFWNGGTDYRVRITPPLTGTWTYRITATDTSNAGIHNIRGTLAVKLYQGDNILYKKGFIKVSTNKRYLTYSDGTPFFWLGDTAWEIARKSRSEQARRYISDRKQKKFSVVQVVPMSHQELSKGFGVINRNGEPYFLDNDYAKPNPRYFDYVDTLVQTMNDSGLVAVLTPLWAYFTEYHPSQYAPERLNREQALTIARYIGSRYAGAHVMWIVAGDNAYETSAQKEFWTTFARTLKTADGGQHLATVHPRGYGSSYEYFDNTTDWLDFNMYQSSHVAEGDYTWQAGGTGYALMPAKPIVDGEPCYEDIYDRLWEPGDTSDVASQRIRPDQTRQACYEAILSGAIVGITYGANGVWQWHTPEQPGSHHPRAFVDSAWKFPGSSQMTVLKDWLTRLGWYTFVPQTSRVIKFEAETNHIAVAQAADSMLVAYLPVNTKSLTLNILGIRSDKGLTASWISPTSGTIALQTSVELSDRRTLITPNSGDWLLIIHPDSALSTAVRQPSSVVFTVQSIFPQPSQGAIALECSIPEPGMVELSVWNVNGGLIYRGGAISARHSYHSVKYCVVRSVCLSA